MLRTAVALVIGVLFATPALAQSTYPAPVEGDFVARGYVFASGDRIPEVKIHYRTVGTPRKDADGVVRNGVLILHGTGGTGAGFLSATYAGRLFGKGQPLDAETLLHHPSRQRRPRPVEQAERRPAHEVSDATATPTW